MASTVTPHTDMDPSPRVDIFIDAADLDGSTVTISVHQISAAGDVVVRGMADIASAGGVADTDYEVPLGIPVTYRVQQFDGSGVELGYVLSLATQVDIEDGKAVFSDPLAPALAVEVNATADFGGRLVRNRPVRTYRAGLQTRALMAMQTLLEDVPLHCETETLEDADMLEAVLASSGFLVRVMPSTRLPAVMHVVVPSPEERPIDVQFGGELVEWNLNGTQISRPEIDILVAVISYGRFADYMATQPANTYAAAAAIWSTYLDAMRNPPPAV